MDGSGDGKNLEMEEDSSAKRFPGRWMATRYLGGSVGFRSHGLDDVFGSGRRFAPAFGAILAVRKTQFRLVVFEKLVRVGEQGGAVRRTTTFRFRRHLAKWPGCDAMSW